jgi:hypothetical protein
MRRYYIVLHQTLLGCEFGMEDARVEQAIYESDTPGLKELRTARLKAPPRDGAI